MKNEFDFEMSDYCEKHKISYWIDSANPVEKRGCPECNMEDRLKKWFYKIFFQKL